MDLRIGLDDTGRVPFRCKERGARRDANQHCEDDLLHIDFLLALASRHYGFGLTN